MSRVKSMRKAIIVFSQVFVLALLISISIGQPKAKAEGLFDITGTVSNSSGVGVAGVSVYATAPGGATVDSQTTTEDGTNGTVLGYYDLPISVAGTYDIHFVPPSGSGLSAIVESNVTVSSSQTLNIQFTPSTYTYSGYVLDGAGNPIPGAQLQLSNSTNNSSQVSTNSAGYFSVSTEPGIYTLDLVNQANASPVVHFVIPNAGTVDLTSGNVSQNIQLDTVTLNVQVDDSSGTPVANAPVSVNNFGTSTAGTTTLLGGPSGTLNMVDVGSQENTNAAGVATFEAVRGMVFPSAPATGVPGGSSGICATINTTVACSTSTTTLTGDLTTVVLQQPTTYTYSGYVLDGAGNPIPGAQLQLSNSTNNSSQVSTNSAGYFSVSTEPGIYTLDLVNQANASPVVHFVIPNAGTVDLTSGNVSQNIQLDTVTLNVQVDDSSGTPVANAPVSVNNFGTSTAGTTTLLGGPSGTLNMVDVGSQENTNAAGVATFEAVRGMVFPSAPATGVPGGSSGICATINTTVACSTSTTTLTGDLTTVVLQQPTTYTYSGYVLDGAGNPIPGAQLQLSNSTNNSSQVSTNSAGYFSVSTEPGIYTLDLVNQANASPVVHFVIPNAGTVDLTSGNVSQNIQLDTVTLNVQVDDSSGTPVANAPVSVNNFGTSTAGTTTLLGGPSGTLNMVDVGSQENTNAAGVATFEAVRGMVFPSAPATGVPGGSSGICATINTTVACSTSTTTLTGDLTTVVLQQALPSPNNLSALSPTNQYPVLTWSSVSGADSYNIYRNGIDIGSTTSTTFTDSNAPLGINTYFVTPVDTNGFEGPASISIQVIYDTTPPTLGSPSWSVNPVIEGQSASLSVPATDSISGVIGGEFYLGTTDPGNGLGTPMTYDGANLNYTFGNLSPGTYVVNVRAEDAAGNWSNVVATDLVVNSVAVPTGLSAPSPTNQYPSLTWNADPGASYYNIYRNGIEIGSSYTTTFTDSNAPLGDNSYYVTAVGEDGTESSPSNIISVDYETALPTITYTLSSTSTPNGAGWYNTPVTVTFTCTDNSLTGIGIASCTSPVTLSTDGSNQTVTGTAVDSADNSSSITATVNLEQVGPSVGAASWSANPIVSGQSSTLTVTTANNAAPITGGEYYIGSVDPGEGNGIPMTLTRPKGRPGENLTASIGSLLAPGTYIINVRAEDAAGNWSSVASTTLTVNPSTVAPTITSPNSYTTGENDAITPSDFTVTTTGTPIASLTESGTLPSGITFTDNGDGTVNFTGEAATGANGVYPITITATNSAGSVSQNFTLIITPAITSANALPSAITVGQPMTPFTVTTEGLGTINIYERDGTGLPNGITLTYNGNGTATISGTPAVTDVGVYSIIVTAHGSNGTLYQTFTIDVNAISTFNTIHTNSLTANVGTAYSLTIKAVGYPVPTLTYSGVLPTGISFVDNGNGTATISGTPAAGAGGTYTITAYATNSSGVTPVTFTITVDQPPAITNASTTINGTHGQAITPFTITTTGFPIPTIYERGTTMDGLTLTDNGNGTATISGSPTKAGTFTITVYAHNSTTLVDETFTIDVT